MFFVFFQDLTGFHFRPVYNAGKVTGHASELDFLSPESLYRDMTGKFGLALADPVHPGLKLDQGSTMSNLSLDFVEKDEPKKFRVRKFFLMLNI